MLNPTSIATSICRSVSNWPLRRVSGSTCSWCAGSNNADAVAARVRDEDVAGAIGRPNHGIWGNLSAGGRTAITTESTITNASKVGNDSRRGFHAKNAAVEHIGLGDEEVTASVQRHAHRHPQTPFGSEAVIGPAAAIATGVYLAGHRGDDAREGIDAADEIVACVGDDEVAGSVNDHIQRVDVGAGSRATIAKV